MKIAILHMTMGLSNRGSETVIDLLSTALAKAHSVLVLASGYLSAKSYATKRLYPLASAPIASPQTFLQKIAFRLRLDARSRMIARFTLASAPTLQEFDPDIVIVINGATQLKIVRSLHLRAKIVCFGHAGIGHDDLATLTAKPDLFIALTATALTWAKTKAAHTTKLCYIPNPFHPSKARPIKLGLQSPVVMVTSALSTYKNVLSVVEATRLAGYSLLVIGDGEERGALEKALSSYPHEFRWIKQLDPHELPSYYRSVDVFCFVPEPQEAFGMVYLEAMGAGLPIVSSDDPIRRALIGGQGHFVKPHDLAALVSSIRAASAQGKLNYSHELQPFALSKVVAAIEKEFYALIA